MRLGVFAKTFAGETPGEVLSAAKAAGFDCVQYNMACSGLGALPRVVPAEAVEAVRAATEATGIGIAAVSATYNMIHPDPSVRATGRAAFEAIAGAARGMGTGIVTVCTGSLDAEDQWRSHPENGSGEAWEDFLAEMRLLLPVAERSGVVIGVEPEMANVVSSAARAREMLDAFPGAPIGIVLDPANLFEDLGGFRDGAVVDEAVEMLADRIVMAHAKDRDPGRRFVAAGSGVVDFGRFLGGLRRAGFDGAVVTHGLSAGEAPGVARFLRGQLG
ncbi:sugar phosphate isomerase/epimerase family protein [Rubellimicrobium mesophilum]|nr:sugar phosphate isomerase/epimerase [Rubellimicrobium mesophilum]